MLLALILPCCSLSVVGNMVHMEQKVPLTAKSSPGGWPEVGGLQDSQSRSAGVLRKKE